MPERSDGYQLPSYPKTLIDRPLWNSTMADLHERLIAREQLEASFEGLIAQGIQASLDYIQVNVAPQLANLKTSIDLAQEQIDQIIVGGKAPDTLKFGGQLPAYYATAQALDAGLAGKVPNTRKVAGKELSDDVVLAKGDVGLGNADNTADKDKPVSDAQQIALDKKVDVDKAQTFSAVQKAQAIANLDVGILAGLRNKLLNGSFTFWQRGYGPFTTSGYTADRWRLEPGAGSANSVTKADFIADDSLPFVDKFTIAWTRTGAGTAPSYLLQKIEGARTHAGKLCTVSVWARSLAATKLRVAVQQRFGAGGSATENYPATSEMVLAGGGGLKRYDFKFQLNGISSKIFGAGNDDALWVLFEWLNTDPNTTVVISRVSIVEGDASKERDPFADRGVTLEEILVKRYYEQVVMYARFFATGGGQIMNVPGYWQTKRTVPAAIFRGLQSGGNLSAYAWADISVNNGGRFEIIAAGGGDTFCLGAYYGMEAEL